MNENFSNQVTVKEIKKSRIIAALLSELDASKATIIAECVATKNLFQDTIKCRFKIPFDESEIEFSINDLNAKYLKCSCFFAGQRISFDLVREANERWLLPTVLTIQDLRQASRLSFTERMYSAEIIALRGVSYGYAIDINRDFLALDLDGDISLTVGEDVQVIVRLINSNIDVFYTKCNVAQIKLNDSSKSRIILRLSLNDSAQNYTRGHERRIVNDATLTLNSMTFESGSIQISAKIENIGLGGITGSVKSNGNIQIISGQILQSKDPEMSFLVVWTQNNLFGLRVILGELKSFTNWNQYIDLVAPPSDRRTSVTRKELASILTHSGLLKGSRRSPFGSKLHDHLVTNAVSNSMLLTQRRIVEDEDGHPILNITLKRVCENVWLYCDVASLGGKLGGSNTVVDASIQIAKSAGHQSSFMPRYLSFIWSHSVTTTGEFAYYIAKSGKAVILDSCQQSIRGFGNQGRNLQLNVGKIDNCVDLGAHERRKISSSFTPELYEAFVGFDGSHPILNAELAKFGPYHHTITKCIRIEGQTIIAHRIKTHSVWSSTGVSNSVFVIIPREYIPKNLPVALSFLAEDSISFGTDDFLLIFDGEEGASQPFISYLSNPKMFSFLVHDLLLNKAFTYHDDYSKQNNIVVKKED